MSYNLYLLRFADGAAVALDAGAFATVTEPMVVERDAAHCFVRLRACDGGEADLYAPCEPDGSLASLMVTHFAEGAVLDSIAAPAHA